MRRILAIILILAVAGLSSCQTMKDAFCSPTAEQIMAAGEKLAQATAMLTYLEGLVATPEVAVAIAALKIAIPILRKIKDGFCVDIADQANAERAVVVSQGLAGRWGYKGP